MTAAALLVAAGSGERLGADRPKAFVALAGRTMAAWSLDALARAGIEHVVLALPHTHAFEDLTALRPFGEPGEPGEPGGRDWPTAMHVSTVTGGATRSASVRNALRCADPAADRIVVHDAARPLVEPALFTAVLAALADADAAVAAAPVTDTVKEAGADRVVVRTLDRARLWAIQTPQAFRREALQRALDVDDSALAGATDDAALVEAGGGRVVVVEASPANFKVTTPHDLLLAGLLLAERAGAAGAAS